VSDVAHSTDEELAELHHVTQASLIAGLEQKSLNQMTACEVSLPRGWAPARAASQAGRQRAAPPRHAD
jgi:hypothetical protein